MGTKACEFNNIHNAIDTAASVQTTEGIVCVCFPFEKLSCGLAFENKKVFACLCRKYGVQ